jgi:hypothetical protein
MIAIELETFSATALATASAEFAQTSLEFFAEALELASALETQPWSASGCNSSG